VSMTLEMEEALAKICELDLGQSFVDVALAIIRMRNCASSDFKEFMLLCLIRALEEQGLHLIAAAPLRNYVDTFLAKALRPPASQPQTTF
jgi:hypothetical protein